MGDRFIRDITDLRAGQAWNSTLLQMIDEADIFQLFWSTNSMNSTYVRQEWEHALSLCRENFIRPVYWEEPLPADPSRNLPPPELLQLHFHKLTRIGGPTALAMMSGPARIEGKARTRWSGCLAISLVSAAIVVYFIQAAIKQGYAHGSYWYFLLLLLLIFAAICTGCIAGLIDYKDDSRR